MRKILLYSMLSVLLLVSCENFKNYRLDGMWQLKTIEQEDGSINYVDTVFYSFQRECVFSYISVPRHAFNPFYGYIIDMPSDNKIHIQMDKRRANDYNTWKDDENKVLDYIYDFRYFLSFSDWSSADIVFDIKQYDKSKLVLYDSVSGKIFTLKKM